jgi:hypothetical protein
VVALVLCSTLHPPLGSTCGVASGGRHLDQCTEPIGRLNLQVRPQDLSREAPKIATAVRAESPHRVRAKHSVALELRFREKLISRAISLATLNAYLSSIGHPQIASGSVLCGLRGSAFQTNTSGIVLEDYTRGGTEFTIPKK